MDFFSLSTQSFHYRMLISRYFVPDYLSDYACTYDYCIHEMAFFSLFDGGNFGYRMAISRYFFEDPNSGFVFRIPDEAKTFRNSKHADSFVE